MATKAGQRKDFNIMIVGQNGRLQYEALLFAASLRHSDPGFKGRLIVAEPKQSGIWPKDPAMGNRDVREMLGRLGAEIVPFDTPHFGEGYPYGNKIQGLAALPKGEPFIFFDTDTLVLGKLSDMAIDFDRPSASMRREGTWPEVPLYGPGYAEIWKSLYDRFGLDFESSLDTSYPADYWRRYLYFNAGWFFYSCPQAFGERFMEYALSVRNNPPPELASQSLSPWLDQVVLPLVIHSFDGGRPGPELDGLDGDVTCHWRALPLLYARESDKVIEVLEEVAAPNKIKKILKMYDPFRRMVFQKRGHKVRALFDRAHMPAREQPIRQQIKKAGLWMR